MGKNEPVSIADEVPFEIPESWEWVRLSSIIELQSGQDLTPDKYNDCGEGLPYITGASNIENESIIINRWTEYGRAFAYEGDLLLTCKGTVGTMAFLKEKQVHIARQIMAIRPLTEINPLFVRIVLESLVADLKAAAKSMIPGISRDDVLTALFPLPPKNEQQRIVDKIADIKPYLDSYNLCGDKIDYLNNSFPDMLKKSILQEAVMGKLVPQDENDEPASVLLERIREEKHRLIAEGKLKKDKHESIIYRRDNSHYEKLDGVEHCIDDEIPFEIPESWEWVRLSEVAIKDIKRGKSPKYADKSDIQVFAQKCNVKTGGIDMSLAKYLDATVFEKYPPEEYMQDNDIVINSTGNGTLGRIGIFHDSDRICGAIIVPDSHVTIIRATNRVSIRYVYYVLKYYQPFLESLGSGSTNQTELKPAVISQLFFPLPPISEQARIVDAVTTLLKPLKKL